MFIDVGPQEARKGIAPTIRVATASSVRLEGKPDRDDMKFEEAVSLALKDAHEHGYLSVAFSSVSEFMRADDDRALATRYERTGVMSLVYEYVWTFTAHNPTDVDARS